MARVLLIEDDDAQRYVAAFALRKAGHVVQEAPDGPHGLVSASEHRPDIIVCDVMMPGMSGYEVVAALRRDPATAATPVILLTAMSERKHMREGMNSGADDYLTKPYKPDELCEAIDAALSRRQSQHQAFLGSVSGMVEEALEEQKEQLGRRYEHQLAREVNARWEKEATVEGDVHFPRAILLLADLLGTEPGEDVANRVRRTQQQARDTLYLFGADHVLPYGTDLLAVFGGGGSVTTPVELRAGRAAFALVKAFGAQQPASIGLHVGPVTLVTLHDSLHGDTGHSLVPGEPLDRVSGLRDIARSEDWRIAVSRDVAELLQSHFTFDRQGQTLGGDEAFELKPAKTG